MLISRGPSAHQWKIIGTKWWVLQLKPSNSSYGPKRPSSERGGVEEAHQLLEVVRDQDRIEKEMAKLLEGEHPSHENLILTQDKWNRALSGLKYHRTFNIPGLQTLQAILQAGINHVLNLEQLDRQSAVEEWIEKILDPTQGYRLAHSFTRGTPKAPLCHQGCGIKGNILGTHTKLHRCTCSNGVDYGVRIHILHTRNYGINLRK